LDGFNLRQWAWDDHIDRLRRSLLHGIPFAGDNRRFEVLGQISPLYESTQMLQWQRRIFRESSVKDSVDVRGFIKSV